ncbi:sensor histidine kinase [Vreelandella populi]|uniref:sensor histidine kinase n=1 Tax=Vreelandella populi TaxID=2498858 RepID=UPI000F8C601D|nr:ATP-binding protein [Halomonas populi]RUR39341.1 histidine kinase [Halomonas populi]
MNNSVFRPRARIMKTLGEELISSDSVALIELVKNAYDADASDVLIKFTGPLDEGTGKLEVIDNGRGMSFDVVSRAWMEPATPSKVKAKETDSGRRVLGEKGIGRFATSRLASMLELTSQKADRQQEVSALFDWTQFDDDKKYLDEIEVYIEERPPSITFETEGLNLLPLNSFLKSLKKNHGTILAMTGMKRKWTNSNFDEIRRGLSRLVSPFEDMPSFNIKITAPDGFEQYSMEIQPPEIIKYPHYTVEGVVKSNGSYSLTYTSVADGLPIKAEGLLVLHPKSGWVMRDGIKAEDFQENYSPPECGELNIKLRVWDRDELGNVKQKVGGTISSIRKDLDNFAGINIYRDGFRVMPYGEPNNDWLRLDIRRVQKPTYRLSNNQILGYVSITAGSNPELKDQSNREGLRENQAYSDLKDIMKCLLSRLEDIRYKSRKKTSEKETDHSSARQGGLFGDLDLSKLRDHISQNNPSDKQAKIIVDNIEQDFSQRMEGVKKIVSRYSGLATLGKLVDAVLHEGRQPLAVITGQSKLAQEDLEDFSYMKHKELLVPYERLNTIKGQAASLNQIFKRIEPFGGRKVGRPSQLYLENVINDAFKILYSKLKDASIAYEISNTETLVRVDPQEIQQIIINLIDNSIYWLQFTPKISRKISVILRRVENIGVEILFSDSGPGVPEDDKDTIFDAYYSTREDGAGLGLSIIGEMVSNYYSGSLELVNGGPLPGATFRIMLCKRV